MQNTGTQAGDVQPVVYINEMIYHILKAAENSYKKTELAPVFRLFFDFIINFRGFQQKALLETIEFFVNFCLNIFCI